MVVNCYKEWRGVKVLSSVEKITGTLRRPDRWTGALRGEHNQGVPREDEKEWDAVRRGR